MFAISLFGCAQESLSKAQRAYRQGNLRAAEKHIDAYVKHHGDDTHRVIAHLEQGSIRRDLGEIRASQASFDIVDEAFTQIDRAPDVSLSRETLAAFSNLNALPFRGTYADRVMLYTFRALNEMELGNPDRARVELRRAYERQVEAVDRNAKKIEEAQAAAKPGKSQGYDAERARRDPGFQAGLGSQYAGLDQYRGYGDYANPFTEWLQGIYYLGEAADGSDIERGRKSLSRAAGMAPGNPFLELDRQMAERIAAGGPIPAVTWVVFATGTAPLRDEIRIDIPLFLIAGNVDYVGANFPRLVENNNYVRSLTARPIGNDSSHGETTQLLCDMDQVIGQEFKNQLPVIITKTLIAAGTKAAAAYALQETFDHHDANVALIVRIATTIYQVAANQADLRTWGSLPKQFQIARMTTPASGKIILDFAGFSPAAVRGATVTGGRLAVELLPGRFNVIMVRSITPTSPIRISQFSLGKDNFP